MAREGSAVPKKKGNQWRDPDKHLDITGEVEELTEQLAAAEGEGFPTTHSIPVKYQQHILQLTLLSLNCFLRGSAKLAPMEKHWQKSEVWSKPKVQVCDPETRVWQKG